MVDFLVFSLHFLWIGGAIITFIYWRRLHDVGDTPEVPIAQAQPGMAARFQGRSAFHGQARTSLIGAVAAVQFDWKIEHREVQRTGGDSTWRTRAQGSSMEPFAVVDESGNRLLVWPMDAVVHDTHERIWDGEFPDTMSSTLRDQLVDGIGLVARLTGFGELRFTEHWLPPDMPCFVIGLVEAPGPDHGPDVRGLVRAGGAHGFFIAAGTPLDALASLRRHARAAAAFAAVMFALAITASIFA